jgi:heptaprenyl diphosphate synthase
MSSLTIADLHAGAEVGVLVDELASPLEHLLSRQGKQLRASLVQRSARAGPEPSSHAVREGALAVELLHLGTLAHDDVVDDGNIRRGSETVGVAYGNRASAFAGGVLVASAIELVARHGQEAAEVFADTVTQICEGEMVEVEDLFNPDRPVERYFHAISGKTAMGFAFAGWIGAWLAGAESHVAAKMKRFGHELGMAFQVLDDILDLCSPVDQTGKQRGKDLQQGVYTFPVLYAAMVDSVLKKDLGRPIDDGELESLVDRVVSSGGVEKAKRVCTSFTEKAGAAISDVPEASRESLLEVLATALAPLDQLSVRSRLDHVRS